MMRTITTAGVALLLTTAAGIAQQGPGPARGSGAGNDPAMAQRQAECQRKADEKGLVGQSRREERRTFMQGCVHGQ
jgi:hypothetical protein